MECKHDRSVTELPEIELYEEYGLSLAEIHSKKYYICGDCEELLYQSGKQFIKHRRH
jgi:hypothetical protein